MVVIYNSHEGHIFLEEKKGSNLGFKRARVTE
jgi:hypothetical protein